MRLSFALAVPVLLVLAVAASLHGFGYPASARSERALAVLAVPPVLAVWAVAGLQALAAPRASAAWRFASVALGGPLVALPLGAFVFSVQHIATYPLPFHFTFSEDGLYVLGWSGATAIYLYLSGLPLYLPWTPVALVALAAVRAAGRRR